LLPNALAGLRPVASIDKLDELDAHQLSLQLFTKQTNNYEFENCIGDLVQKDPKISLVTFIYKNKPNKTRTHKRSQQ
jgi:hypothetical protein